MKVEFKRGKLMVHERERKRKREKEREWNGKCIKQG